MHGQSFSSPPQFTFLSLVQEDRIVQSMVQAAGTTKPDWNKIADAVNEANHKNRSGKQCRERYVNHLRPNIKKGSWTKDEENMIRYYYETFGPK